MKKLIYSLVLIFVTLNSCSTDSSDDSPTIKFTISESEVNVLSRNNLQNELTSHTISYYDTVHQKNKNMRAFVLREVLELGFSIELETKPNATFTFSALDGFQDSASGDQALEAGGYIAFEDLDVEGIENWELVARENNNNPAPFYVIWTGSNQVPDNSYPWPYQLASINMAE